MDDVISKLVILRQVKLFEELPADVLAVVAQEAKWREYGMEELLFSEGDEPDGLFIIASGTVEITKGEETVAYLKEYDFFGEVGLIDDTPRTATATGKEEGMLLYIDQITCNDLLYEFPEVLHAISRVIIGYLKSK